MNITKEQLNEQFREKVNDLMSAYPELWIVEELDGVRVLDDFRTVENAFRTAYELATAVDRLSVEVDLLKQQLEDIKNAK